MKHKAVVTTHRESSSTARRRLGGVGVAGAVLATVVGAGGGAYGAYSAASNVQGYEDSTAAAPNAIFKGGPVRVGSSVYAHANDTHAVIGITAVNVVNCNLVLTLDNKPGQRVMAAVVEEDESISKLGIQAGLSGGSSKGTISFFKSGKKVCADSPIFNKVSNVWVSIVTMDAPPVPAE